MKSCLSIEHEILNYARQNGPFGVPQIIDNLGLNRNSISHYLTKLSSNNQLERIGRGQYQIRTKQNFTYFPPEDVISLFKKLKKELPFTDFCIYDGSIFSTLQHHIVVNNAIYVECNRDVIDTVFNRLKDQGFLVYKQPDSEFVFNYINLQERCLIIKAYVTEAPVRKYDNIVIPTLEKLLVDIQKDSDFDYMRGSESHYMFETAVDQFSINRTKLLRYARRRGCKEMILKLLTKFYDHD